MQCTEVHRNRAVSGDDGRPHPMDVPDKVGIVKLTQAVTLHPKLEYLLWGRLPSNVPMSPRNTIVVEPTSSLVVGRVVTHLWGDV